MRILFIKLGGIGDVIQAAAAVNAFRLKHPDTHLEWVVGKGVAALLSDMRVADRIHAIDDSVLIQGRPIHRVWALIKLACFLSLQGRFDEVVIGYNDWRYRLIPVLVRRGKTRYFSNRAKRPSPLQHRNRVFEYFHLLANEESQTLDIPGAMARLGENLFRSLPPLTRELNQDYVLLVPGGAKNLISDDALRRWPLENYQSMAQWCIDRKLKVIIAGGKDDQWVCDTFNGMKVDDLVGKTELTELWSIMNRAKLVVTHDTGPLHMALAGKAPVIAIFGPTPSQAIIPAGRNHTIALQALHKVPCAPCYSGKNYAPCGRPLCMEAVTLGDVMATAEILIGN